MFESKTSVLLKWQGVQTIDTNHPGGNPVRKHNKTIEFDVVGEQPATKCIQFSWTDRTE